MATLGQQFFVINFLAMRDVKFFAKFAISVTETVARQIAGGESPLRGTSISTFETK